MPPLCKIRALVPGPSELSRLSATTNHVKKQVPGDVRSRRSFQNNLSYATCNGVVLWRILKIFTGNHRVIAGGT